jgi:hypothetical protein
VTKVGVHQQDRRGTAGKRGGEVDRDDGFPLPGHCAGDEDCLQSPLFPNLQKPLAQDPETFLRRGRELARGKNALLGLRLAKDPLCVRGDLRP